MTIELVDMTREELEAVIIEHELAAKIMGFKNSEAMSEYKYHAAEGMVRFGGSFICALGHALMSADLSNSLKILTQWDSECKEHAALHRKFILNRNTMSEPTV